jgi:hypothetical protein
MKMETKMEKINLVELLKDCPSGMELNCTMYDNLYFDKVDTIGNIKCYTKSKDGFLTHVTFHENGCYDTISNAKCVIFPKGKTTWEGVKAPFKDGDIVSTDDGIFTAIVGKVAVCEVKDLYNHNEGYDTYCQIYYEEDDDKAYFVTDDTPSRFDRLATEEEKERLFQAIKENGYKWNAETKTLEELVESKFDITTLKPFDKVLIRDNGAQMWSISFFSHCNGLKAFKFSCINGNLGFEQCIPYEGNEHLLGTYDDCDEYFKNWK